MPRARAHILDLIEKHTDTQNSIIALEDSIEDVSVFILLVFHSSPCHDLFIAANALTLSQASHPSHGPSESLSLFDEEPTFDHDEDHEEIHKQSPEEWLKKEEDELKKLEADVAELRKQVCLPLIRSAAVKPTLNRYPNRIETNPSSIVS